MKNSPDVVVIYLSSGEKDSNLDFQVRRYGNYRIFIKENSPAMNYLSSVGVEISEHYMDGNADWKLVASKELTENHISDVKIVSNHLIEGVIDDKNYKYGVGWLDILGIKL